MTGAPMLSVEGHLLGEEAKRPARGLIRGIDKDSIDAFCDIVQGGVRCGRGRRVHPCQGSNWVCALLPAAMLERCRTRRRSRGGEEKQVSVMCRVGFWSGHSTPVLPTSPVLPPAIAALLFLIPSLRAPLDSLQDFADGSRSLNLTVRSASVGAAVGCVARHTCAPRLPASWHPGGHYQHHWAIISLFTSALGLNDSLGLIPALSSRCGARRLHCIANSGLSPAADGRCREHSTDSILRPCLTFGFFAETSHSELLHW